GEVLLSLISMEEKLRLQNVEEGIEISSEINQKITNMYRAFYSKVMINYYFPRGGRGDGTKPLHLFRAVMKALRRYGTLDKWEWYLLNTYVTEDDNVEQEKELDRAISDYRSGKLNF